MTMQDVDEVEAARRRLMEALRTGTPQNPDQLAQDRAEAARRGTTVQQLRAAREAGVTVPNANWHALPTEAPRTSEFLSNPTNAAVAHDDIENMSAVERIVARIGERTVRLGQSFLRTALTAVDAPADFLEERIPLGVLSFEDGRIVRRPSTAADRRSQVGSAGMSRALDPDTLHRIAPGSTWEEVKAAPVSNFIPYALEEGIVSLPDMAAVLANLPAYVAARTGDIGQSRADNDGRTEATVQDLVAALPPAAASAFLERLGTRGIIGLDDALRGGARGIPGAVARAGLREGLTEAGQGLIEYAGTNLGTEAGFDPVEALDQMAAGAAAGTPFGAAVRTVTATGEAAAERMNRRQADADAGVRAGETLQELATLGEASKLRERDPQTFQQFVEQASEGTEIENIYIDAQTFAQSLETAGVPLDDVITAIPGLGDQLTTAAETGGDVRISAGEFAAHIAGTDAVTPLLPHMRTDPFAMSQAQAKEFMSTRGDELQAEVEAATVAATANEELRASRERVFDRIAAELDNAGRFTSDVNRAYASLPAAFYDVMGARLGITAEQAAERYPLKFSAELPTSAGRTVLEQDAEVELVHFSDSAGLTASDPSKWGGTRATQNSERERRNAGAPMRTYFGVEGVYKGEPGVGINRRPYQYRARVPASKLYDFDADPQGLKPTEGTPQEIATAYEKAIQAAGFSGYRSDAVLPGAVAVFEPVEMKQTATVEERFSPENIGSLLEHDDWSILTAENPRGEQATPEANAKAQAKLTADLDALGVQYLPAVGRYGQIENSFVVTGITEAQARELGKKYDQDSVLTHKGLIYQDGRIDPATGVTVHDARPDDFFTEVPGTGALFTVDIDFGEAAGAITDTPAFKAWFGDSKVVDAKGEPLVVYRGQHSGSADPETRLGSFTFGDRETASLYALDPNDSRDTAEAPFVIPAYLSIQRPIVDSKDGDPYLDLDILVDALGLDATVAILRADRYLRDTVENTSAWQDGPGRDYGSVNDMLDEAPARVDELTALAFSLLDKPAVVEALKAAGFDGAIHGGTGANAGETEYRVFEPTQIKSVFNNGAFDPADARILYQETFYSALARAVENSPTKSAPAAQWKATLAKTAGVKKEEIEWSGINDWLDIASDEYRFETAGAPEPDAKGNITREAVLGFLRASGVQVEETVLGDPSRADTYTEADILREGRRIAEEEGEDFASNPSYWRARGTDELIAGERPAHFSTYKLPGADDTYREILLTLPGIDGPSTHWDTPNVVAHARITMREDASGKRVLFLEELQSDWHQKGRDEGYQRKASDAEVQALRDTEDAATEDLNVKRELLADAIKANLAQQADALDAAIKEYITNPLSPTVPDGVHAQLRRLKESVAFLDNGGDPARLLGDQSVPVSASTPEIAPVYREFRDALLKRQEARVALDALRYGIPDAPFRTSWSTLLMKRMIRYAVDNGAEKVAWINGNQQNGGQTGGDGSFFYERNLVNTTNDLLKKYGTRVAPVDMRPGGTPLSSPYLDMADERIARAEQAGRADDAQLIREEVEAERARLLRPGQALGVQNGFEITPHLAEAARSGFALFQTDRGQIAFGQDISQTPSVISLLRAADLSTFIHETGHFFLEATAHMANAADAPADVVADMATVLNWFEPNLTLERWNLMSAEQRRPYHEKWARGFEAYHFEGKAPSLALRDVFRRFSAWLKNVYKTLTGLDVELTDDVRAVMDRMLASEAEIAEMEQVRSFAPLFNTKPEGMSEDEWSTYQRLGSDATAEAIEQLEQRSARDMRWASGAKDRYVRSLQREAEDQRKAIRAEVTAEVMAEPVNRARNFLRRGLGENGEPVEGAVKLDLAALKELYGDEGEWTKLRRGGKYGEVATGGAHPDAVATMFGYPSGEALISDLVNGEIAADKIKGQTDQRMLERYGDLSDPQSVERAANEAVANDARTKFVAAEMAALDKAVGKRSILNEAARDFAAGVVNRLVLKRLRPAQYLAAQGRAAKAAEKALAKDDLVAAATAKRNQLINLHTGRAVMKAQKDVEKNTRLFTRVVSAKDDAISRTRNMDLVNGARAILSLYGFGRVKNDPIGYMNALERYDPVLYADLQPFVEAARASAKPILELTYEEFQGLRDVVGQLWALSRRVKQIEIDGKMVDLKMATAELSDRLDGIGIKPDRPGVTRAVTDKEKRDFDLLGVRAALRRVESWTRGIDQANRGPFRRYLWNPVSEAADRYRAEAGVYTRRFRDLLDTVRDELKPKEIAAPELGYTFGGKSELYHALLHTGNGSNKSKLLLGRGWGKRDADGLLDDSRWQLFIDRMHAEGTLTAKDWTFVQAVWDMLEDTKAGAQRAHRAIYGRYFDEVAADPVDTPFGQLRGGYVPALTDQNMVQDAALRAEQEAVEGGDSAMFPAASNGFTKSRVEDYTRELALDLRMIPSHVDKVLKFSHLGPAVRDIMRVLKSRDFSAKLQAFDPTAQSDLLLPWLQRAAKQIVETPTKGRAGKWADRAFSYIRSSVGMQLMFANVVNTAQQLTGFSGVLLRVKASNLNTALFRYARDPKGVAATATSKSTLLRNRADSEIFEARQAITQLVKLNPNVKDQAVDFAKRHAYFMQSALQNVMDVVSWSAAYDQAVAKGEDDVEAIRFADSVIRETQGTMNPEDISRFETGSPFVRMFTQFAGYFNMMANLSATEVQLVARGVGVRKGAGRLFYVYLMTLLIPAVIGDAIAKGLRGGWEDEDDDGYLNDLIPWFFASQAKFAMAAVPGVGQAANAAIGSFTDAPYDDRVSLSPAVSVIEAGLGTPAELYQSIVDGESFNKSDVRDALNLVGILTGTPAGVLAKPVGYGVGVAQGDIEPTGPVDVARGLVTGAASPESRQ